MLKWNLRDLRTEGKDLRICIIVSLVLCLCHVKTDCAGISDEPRDFVFFAVSDTHYGSMVETIPEATGKAGIDRMNALPGTEYPIGMEAGTVGIPMGVLHCGDTTNEGLAVQRSGFYADFGLTGEARLHFPVYETFGNHDGTDQTRNAIKERNLRRPNLTRISENGLHYSWDWYGIHFVCLGVCPGLTYTPFNPADSRTFLTNDLRDSVGNSGRPVILYHHFGFAPYSLQWWPPEDLVKYYEAIRGYNVISIIHGHEHDAVFRKWNGIDTIHTPHLVPQDPSHSFTVVRIHENVLSAGVYYADGWGETMQKTFSVSPDPGPPTPNPAAFNVYPRALGPVKVEMTAMVGADSTGVEYYFAETTGNSGGADSGWQDSPNYIAVGLTPDTQYAYTVRMRDFLGQEGEASEPAFVVTDMPEEIPPEPNPALFTKIPTAESSTVVSMKAATGTDLSDPIEYYFTETTGGPGSSESGWQINSYYSDAGLIPDVTYTYTVKTRDVFGNETAPSEPVSVTTLSEGTRDVTFFVISDTRYDGTDANRKRMDDLVDNVNALPGKPYPSQIGGIVGRPNAILTTGDNTAGGNLGEWIDWISDWGLNGTGGRCDYPVFECAGETDSGFSGAGIVPDWIIVRSQSRNGLTNVSQNGLHYSFDCDDVHFVCLNNYAGDVADPEGKTESWNDPSYSLSFLKSDLAEYVGNSGRPVILYQHYGFDAATLEEKWWTDKDVENLRKAVRGYNVISILNGHNHGTSTVGWNNVNTRSMGADANGYFVFHVKDNTMYVLYRTRVNDDYLWAGNETQVLNVVPDADPPLPNQASFAPAPTAIGPTRVEMRAATGSDASGVVEYYFTEITGNPGGSDSGWQEVSRYVDDGLEPDAQYAYTVQMRDFFLQSGGVSDVASTLTPGPDSDPPQPNPAVFAGAPKAIGNSRIIMTAAIGVDTSTPIEYYFAETSGNPGGTDGSWRTNPEYSDGDLDAGTEYTYTVTMRDGEGNVGAASSPMSAETYPVSTVPVPLVDVRAEGMPLGGIATWTNEGTFGGAFHSSGTYPAVEKIGGRSAVVFDGNDVMIADFGAPDYVTGNDGYTVAIWAYNPTIGRDECMFSWAKPGTIGRSAQINYTGNGYYGAVAHSSDGNMAYDGGLPDPMKWHHIVLTYPGGRNGTERIYVDGKLNALESKTLNLWVGDHPVIGGAMNSKGEASAPYFSGSISRLQIFDEELSEEQVSVLLDEYPVSTHTPSPTDTPPPPTPTETVTDTPVNTPTETATDTPVNTPTETPVDTPTETVVDTPTETPLPTSTFRPEDINKDGRVDDADLLLLMGNWHKHTR